MIEQGCVVCRDGSATVLADGNADRYKIMCPACGTFCITGSASRLLATEWLSNVRQIANARGWVRENRDVTLNSEDVQMLRTLATPTVAQRAEKLLIILSKSTPAIGGSVSVDRVRNVPGSNLDFWCASAWCVDAQEVVYLVQEYLDKTKGWVQITSSTPYRIQAQISPKGYDYLESIRVGEIDRATGFCAMWFNSEVTSAWSDAIKPAIRAAGYDAIRIDGVEHNNKIDDEILASIRASRFVVSDFTGERGGVYFEAGFAMGLGRPVIWTVREDFLPKIHFDNRQYNFIVWKPDDLPDFAKRLQMRIEATIGRGPL